MQCHVTPHYRHCFVTSIRVLLLQLHSLRIAFTLHHTSSTFCSSIHSQLITWKICVMHFPCNQSDSQVVIQHWAYIESHCSASKMMMMATCTTCMKCHMVLTTKVYTSQWYPSLSPSCKGRSQLNTSMFTRHYQRDYQSLSGSSQCHALCR